MEQPAVDDGAEPLAQPFQVQRVGDLEPGGQATFRRLGAALSMASPDTSTPIAAAPWAAASRTCSPVPQPASRVRPDRSPASARRAKTGCGRPMSQGGGLPWYAESHSADGVVMTIPLIRPAVPATGTLPSGADRGPVGQGPHLGGHLRPHRGGQVVPHPLPPGRKQAIKERRAVKLLPY